MDIMGALGLSELPEESPSLPGSSASGRFSFSHSSENGSQLFTPQSLDLGSPCQQSAIENSSIAAPAFDHFSFSQQRHRPALLAEASKGLQFEPACPHSASQATHWLQQPSRIATMGQEVEMCTQFAAAVRQAQHQEPNLPDDQQIARQGDAFFDFDRYSREKIMSLMQTQQVQTPDPSSRVGCSSRPPHMADTLLPNDHLRAPGSNRRSEMYTSPLLSAVTDNISGGNFPVFAHPIASRNLSGQAAM